MSPLLWADDPPPLRCLCPVCVAEREGRRADGVARRRARVLAVEDWWCRFADSLAGCVVGLSAMVVVALAFFWVVTP